MNKRAFSTVLAFLFFFGYLLYGYMNNTIPGHPMPSPRPTWESTSSATRTATPSGEMARVARVVDGDTVELETGEKVRYIGMNTPETVDPRKSVECFGKEASDKNKELVEGQDVLLERDVSDKDQYDRLLRYVWVGDTMVNELLVRQGYAQVTTYPPDVKYKDRFVRAQQAAQEESIGLWGAACVTPTP